MCSVHTWVWVDGSSGGRMIDGHKMQKYVLRSVSHRVAFRFNAV